MADTIFDDHANDPNVVITTPQTPSIPDHLKDMIGEGKKYASVEKALESLPHAQSHIQRIEEENRKMREEIARATAAEEAYKKLMEELETKTVTPVVTPGLDEASIASLFDRKLAEREQMQVQAQNVKRVLDGLKGKYGEKAQEVYEAKAKELGIGTGFLNDLVKSAPKAAEELFGITAKPTSGGPTPPGSVNTAVLNNRPHEDKPARGPLSGGSLEDAWARAKASIPKE